MQEEFRDFGDGSFRAVMWWVNEKDGVLTYFQSLCIMDWEDVQRIEAFPMPNPYPDSHTPEGPKCVLVWCGEEVKLRASFPEVAKARAHYRRSNIRRILSPN